MIKFNGNEIPHTYFNEDNIVLDIQSSYPISVFADKLRKHELNDDDYTITAFTNNNGASVYYHSLAEQNMSDNGPSFTHLFDGEVEEGLNDIESEGRNIAFVKYESYQFGNTTPECAVIEDFSINPDNPKYADNYKILYDNVMDALGIMPTLANMEDVDNYSINDLIKDSQDGNHLYWAFEYIGDTNKIPSINDIKLYQSLNSYEKRLFNESQLNPAYKLSVVKGLKELNKNMVLTQNLLKVMEDMRIDKNDLMNTYFANDNLKNSDDFLMADEAFKKANRGRSPRVLPEMIMAWRNYYHTSKLTSKEIKEIVDNFTLASLSQIAKYNNPALYILANELHFNEIPKEHIEVFASYLTVNDVKRLEEKGFIDWYKDNHELGASYLSSTLEAVDNIDHFDIGKTAQQLIYEKSQKRGLAEAEEIKRRYGIDFADNVVAIPGRGVRATDGKNVMYMLKPDDARNITVGYDTHCCQHLGGAGGTCMLDAISNPSSAITVIEDVKTQKIKAQAWTRYDSLSDTLVFDNMEFANDGEVQSFSPLITAWSMAMPEKNIHVGTGFNQGMTNWGKQVSRANTNGGYVHFENENSSVGGSSLYTDYHSQNARCIKKSGDVLLNSNISDITISREPENENEYSYMINPVVLYITKNSETKITTQMKKDIYASLDSDEPFPQDYVKILVGGDKKNTGSLIENIKTLSLESQRYILENKPDAVQYIKNVNPDIALEVLKKTPNKIKDMSDVTYEQAEAVLGINGLLLEFVTEKPSWQNFTKEQKDLLVSCAITQNPYAIKRMKDPDPKWVSMAIFKKKDIIISYPKVSEYIWVSVLKTYPHMIKYAINPTYKMQATAIRKNPYVLNEIKNPDTKIIHEAIGLCGSLILNPKYKPYIDNNTRKAAIKNNPFIADKLDDISTDEKKIVNRINSYKDEEFEVNDLNDMSLELA